MGFWDAVVKQLVWRSCSGDCLVSTIVAWALLNEPRVLGFRVEVLGFWGLGVLGLGFRWGFRRAEVRGL